MPRQRRIFFHASVGINWPKIASFSGGIFTLHGTGIVGDTGNGTGTTGDNRSRSLSQTCVNILHGTLLLFGPMPN